MHEIEQHYNLCTTITVCVQSDSFINEYKLWNIVLYFPKLYPQDSSLPQDNIKRPRKVPVYQKAAPITPSSTQREHKVFMYEFNDSQNSNPPIISLINRSSPGANTTSQSTGQSDPEKLISPVYGVVPYLTSTWDNQGESPDSKHLTMTSSAPISIEQLIPSESEPKSLIVSIPRSLSHFNYVRSDVNAPPTKHTSLGGPRRKVLQNLAKKIAQKSRKYTTNAQSKNGSFGSEVLSERVCSSCRRGNPADKRQCAYCRCVLIRDCTTCGMLNSTSAMSCGRCHGNLTYTTGECK